jgi:nitrogen fixation-related uncharacterized protein
MGAIFMFILVSLIACVGGIYFIWQDKKHSHDAD